MASNDPAALSESQSTVDEEPVFIEKWNPIIDAIHHATRDGFPDSPPYDPTDPSSFQSYWRNVFTRVQESIASDSNIPEFLTEPPIKNFTMTFFDVQHALGCPCCLPDVHPSIDLRNETGVTKHELMEAFIEYLYGESLPQIYTEDDGELTDATGVLVYSSDWMSKGDSSNDGSNDGGRIAYDHAYGEGEPFVSIFSYCCPPEKFREKSRKVFGAGYTQPGAKL